MSFSNFKMGAAAFTLAAAGLVANEVKADTELAIDVQGQGAEMVVLSMGRSGSSHDKNGRGKARTCVDGTWVVSPISTARGQASYGDAMQHLANVRAAIIHRLGQEGMTVTGYGEACRNGSGSWTSHCDSYTYGSLNEAEFQALVPVYTDGQGNRHRFGANQLLEAFGVENPQACDLGSYRGYTQQTLSGAGLPTFTPMGN